MTAIPLKACPFCGNSNVKVNEKRRGNYRREGDNYQVWCTRCKGRGPLVQDSPEGAAHSWNARACLSPPMNDKPEEKK